MPENEDRDKVSWNVAEKQTSFVFSLMQKAINAYLAGDINTWFWYLTAIREMINYDLQSREKKLLDKVEKKAKRYNFLWNSHKKDQKLKKNTQVKVYKTKLIKYIRFYQRTLMTLLNELGYFPAKEDRSKIGF